MKKVLIIALLFCLLPMAFCCNQNVGAYAKEPDTDAVFSSHENIADVVSITIGNKCVVGARTKGIVSKTQRETLFDALAQTVKENFPQITEVYLTTSVREIVYLKNAKQQLFEEAEDTLTVYSEILERLESNYVCR